MPLEVRKGRADGRWSGGVGHRFSLAGRVGAALWTWLHLSQNVRRNFIRPRCNFILPRRIVAGKTAPGVGCKRIGSSVSKRQREKQKVSRFFSSSFCTACDCLFSLFRTSLSLEVAVDAGSSLLNWIRLVHGGVPRDRKLSPTFAKVIYSFNEHAFLWGRSGWRGRWRPDSGFTLT